MVLWLQTRFAVILVLTYLICVKTENDLQLQRISSSSIGLMQRELQRYCAKVPLCRYSKVLTSLRDSFDIQSETPSFNLKVKKKLTTGIPEGSDSLESGMTSENNGLQIEDLDRNNVIPNSYDDLDFFKLDEVKRGNNLPRTGCDCRVKNDLLDFGPLYYPRYLFNAVCYKDDTDFGNPPKCLPGAQCRPLEYKVRLLTERSNNENIQNDPTVSLLPRALQSQWKFKTVTIAAGCFCS